MRLSKTPEDEECAVFFNNEKRFEADPYTIQFDMRVIPTIGLFTEIQTVALT